MTRVQLHYELTRPLGEDDLEGVANVHSVYGISRVQVGSNSGSITVEYDASRLSERDVESALVHHGVPIQRIA